MLQCGKDGHFIKDCSSTQDQNSQYHHSHNHHKGGYSPPNTNIPNSDNTLATLAKAVNDLSLLLKEHTQKSHNSSQAQNHTHRHQHYRHSSHTKNSYYNKPDHSNNHRSQNTQHSSMSQIIAIITDHKTLNIVHTTDHNIALSIDHTIIHKTDHKIDNNTNTALKSMR